MTSNPERIERLQVAIPLDELKAIEDFRFRHRMPNRTAAVRELIRRGLAASEKQTSTSKKNRKISGLKIFRWSDFVPLESE
jgi:metal-responsive CopG/Arc/MetJ family transcriptional regulator